MSVLRKPYELSVWEDVLMNGVFQENKICIIGSSEMTSQSRAINPKLVTNVNGSNTFTFSIYYTYKDNMTGEAVENPFAQYLTNERKLKLKYDNKWYDLLIKSVKVDSSKYTYDVTATDQYTNELSKNGFNTTFDAELTNNVGSIQTLAQRALTAQTDWVVPSVGATGSNTEFIPDTANETLVKLATTSGISATRVVDTTVGIEPTTASETIPSGKTIYACYSCCKEKAKRFQFFYFADESEITIDNERIITNKNHQYYVDGLTYVDNTTYGIGIPTVTDFDSIESKYRGARYVYSAEVEYNNTLETYVTIYYNSNDEADEGEEPPRYKGYTKTTYEAPVFLYNWVSNATDYKSTSGWEAATSSSGSAVGKVTNVAIRHANNQIYTLIDDLKGGNYSGQTYTSALKYEKATNNDILVNTGFYDNRVSIGTITNNDKFVVRFQLESALPNGLTLRLGDYDYDAEHHYYNLSSQHTFFQTSSFTSEGNGWYSAIVTIANSNMSERQFKYQAPKVVLVFSGLANMYFYDVQVFKYVPKGTGYMTLDDQNIEAKIITTYYIYSNTVGTETTKTKEDYNPLYKSTVAPESVGYYAPIRCEKRRSITVKESNYFNIIQTLCENFECWADFIITHDNDGRITSKTLEFHNYIGDENYAGFRYGVNLKSVARTDDSKQIVTKLIVKQNNNEFGKDGFCTIARAPSNETGENYIYNLDYYINQGLLLASDWNDSIYDTTGAEGPDVNPSFDPEHDIANCNGYYVRLSKINAELTSLNEALVNQATVLTRAYADKQLYQNALQAAKDSYDEASQSFKQLTGKDFTQARLVDQKFLNKNIKYLTACAEALQAVNDYTDKEEDAALYYDSVEAEYQAQARIVNKKITDKEILNKAFFSKYYRYIQEGTWNSEEYYDDEQYYLDALSTAYNSSVPKVSYTISVLELSQLPGYEDFTFALGDRTFMEDPEFFGYDEDGAPIREEVVLSEITYNLDSPEKNTIKVQNYASSFQDLFKKITATVQSVQYSSGAYEKAGELANAQDAKKSQYLQGALNYAGTILQNLGEQSVRMDNEGLTIYDALEQNKQLRAVAGGILLSEDGGNTWLVGITAQGISAKVLTTGTLNTGDVNIMYGDEPTFRWDAYGITAYDFDDPYQPNLYKGVRFDRMGIYGFELSSQDADGADWHPNAVAAWTINNDTIVVASDDSTHKYIRNHSIFEFTEQGLYLNLTKAKDPKYYHYYDEDDHANTDSDGIIHTGTVQLGKIEDIIYNTWRAGGSAYYDSTSSQAQTFVKVMSITQQSQGGLPSEEFALYDDGAMIVRQIYLLDGISFSDGSGLIKAAYITSSTRPSYPSGTWDSLPDTGTSWHKIQQTSDNWGVSTSNGGISWMDLKELDGKPGTPGDSTILHDIYYYTTNTSAPTPDQEVTTTTVSAGTWTLTYQAPTSTLPYVFHAIQTKVVTQTSTDLTWTIPELYNAYDGTAASQKYAEYLKLTGFSNQEGIYYSGGHLYINATMIHAGAITIGSLQNPVFQADYDNQIIKINANGLVINTDPEHPGGSIDASELTITHINADAIDGGIITIGSASDPVFIADYDNQRVRIKTADLWIDSDGTYGSQISANVVRTGVIESRGYQADSGSNYAQSGSIFDLDNGIISTKWFYSNSTGCGFKGTLEGANGTFTGNLSAAHGSFAGTLDATSGTFTSLSLLHNNTPYATIGWGGDADDTITGFSISINLSDLVFNDNTFYVGTSNTIKLDSGSLVYFRSKQYQFYINSDLAIAISEDAGHNLNKVAITYAEFDRPIHRVSTLPSSYEYGVVYWLQESDSSHPGWTKLTPYIHT